MSLGTFPVRKPSTLAVFCFLANDLYNKFIKAHLEKVKDVKVEYNDLLGNIEKRRVFVLSFSI